MSENPAPLTTCGICGSVDVAIEQDAAITYEPVRVEPRPGDLRGPVLIVRLVDGPSQLDSWRLYCRDCGTELHLQDATGCGDWQDEPTWAAQQARSERAPA